MPEFQSTTVVPENLTLINTEFSKNETAILHTEMTTEEIPEQITLENMNENDGESKNENSKDSTFQHNMHHIYNGPI